MDLSAEDKISVPLYTGTFSVPFYWADPAGFLFFGYIYLAAQSAWENWARLNPDVWSLWFSDEEMAYPIRHSSAEYFVPLRFGESFEVAIFVESVTESTFILRTEFKRGESLHASARTVHTALDLKTLNKGILNHRLRSRFRK